MVVTASVQCVCVQCVCVCVCAHVCVRMMVVTIIMGTNERHPLRPWQLAPPPNQRLATRWESSSSSGKMWNCGQKPNNHHKKQSRAATDATESLCALYWSAPAVSTSTAANLYCFIHSLLAVKLDSCFSCSLKLMFYT